MSRGINHQVVSAAVLKQTERQQREIHRRLVWETVKRWGAFGSVCAFGIAVTYAIVQEPHKDKSPIPMPPGPTLPSNPYTPPIEQSPLLPFPPAKYPVPGYYNINHGKAGHLRTGPGEKFKSIGELLPGSCAAVIEFAHPEWAKVSVIREDGRERFLYIERRLLSRMARPPEKCIIKWLYTPTRQQRPPQTRNQVQRASVDGVQVRFGPGNEFPLFGYLRRGQCIGGGRLVKHGWVEVQVRFNNDDNDIRRLYLPAHQLESDNANVDCTTFRYTSPDEWGR